jgi:hypothetical protein
MTRQTITHEAPNVSPSHIALLNIFSQSGDLVAVEQLRKLLWLLNIDDRLTALLTVCRNLLSVVNCMIDTWGLVVEGEDLGWIRDIVGRVISHRPLLVQVVGHHIDPAISGQDDNPLWARDSVRHPLHALLCRTADETGPQIKPCLLQGHLLLSHIKALRKGSTLDKYQEYSGKGRWKGRTTNAWSG